MDKPRTIKGMIKLIKENPSIIATDIEMDPIVIITKEQALLETIKFLLHYGPKDEGK